MNRLQLCILISLRRQGYRFYVPFLLLALLLLTTLKAVAALCSEAVDYTVEAVAAFLNGGPVE